MMSISFVLLFSYLARADDAVATAACDDSLARAVARPADLPSPLPVDPEDEGAIIRFIDAVTPLIDHNVGDALAQTIERFWAKYRPDLNAVQIRARLGPHRPTRFALLALRKDPRSRKLGDVGRLRLCWMDFIRDTFPEAPPISEAAVHRADILTARHSPVGIVNALKMWADVTTVTHPASVASALAILYRRYLPHATPPTAADVAPEDYGAEIKRLWLSYLDAVTVYRPMWTPPTTRPPILMRYDLHPALDPVDVPLSPRAMIEYLVARYPDLDPKAPGALARYVTALRNDYGLPPSTVTFDLRGLRNALHHRVHNPAARTLFAAWTELYVDRAKVTRTRAMDRRLASLQARPRSHAR